MTKQIAIVIPPDFTLAHVVTFQVGDSYTWLADAVDGMIECVHVQHGMDMWVNEEFLMRSDLDYNPIATELYWHKFGLFSHFIHGTVVMTTCDHEGNTTGLTLEQLSHVGDLLLEFGVDLDLTPLLQG